MRNITICFINQKGGCGKTASCFHVGGYFAKRGASVLLIDADPQGSLSQNLLGPAFVEALTSEQTLATLFEEERIPTPPEELVLETNIDRLHIIPANQTLARYNVPVPEETGLRQHTLSAFLQDTEQFDIVLIDCPPNLYQCSWNALLATHFVIIPVPPEDPGAQGLTVVHDAIENARVLNPCLELLGHLVMRVDKRYLIHRRYEENLRNLYGETVFESTVPETSALKVAIACRTPISHHAPKSKAAVAVASFAGEMLQRIAEKTGEQGVA